jgi:phage baseplate assembly protein W
MRENFGSSLLRQVFEPGTSATASDIRSMVVGGVRKWDPRIAITSCETTMIGNEMKVSIGLKNVKDPRETSAIMLDFNITPNGISVNR